MSDSLLTAIVCSLQDSVMLLAPMGWSSVELRFVATPQGLRLEELETKGDGTTEPRPKPELHIEQKNEVVRINEGLVELLQRLEQTGKRWTPGTIRVERPTPDFVDWKLVSAEGSVVWFTRLTREELGALIVTDELFDVLRGTQAAFDELQEQLEARLGRVTGFRFDGDAARLHLERPSDTLSLAAEVVGQYHPESFTWVWGWSDEEAPRPAVERFEKLCAPELRQDGMSAFWRPAYHCDEGFAWAVAASAAVTTGARGLFRASVDGQAVFFAIRELPPPPLLMVLPSARRLA